MKSQQVALPLYVYPSVHREIEKNETFVKQISKAMEEHQKVVFAKESDENFWKTRISGCYQNIITSHLTSKGKIFVLTELSLKIGIPNTFKILHSLVGFIDDFNCSAFAATKPIHITVSDN